MNIIKDLKAAHQNALISCCDEHCKLHVDNHKKHIILKGEKLSPLNTQKMCDCIIIYGETKIAIVELKKTVHHINQIREKFTNTIDKVTNILPTKQCSKIDFYLILLSNRYALAVGDLHRLAFSISGRTHRLQTRRCGTKFIDIIKSGR